MRQHRLRGRTRVRDDAFGLFLRATARRLTDPLDFGREIDEGSDFSVVSTSFMVGDATGRIVVLGPTRMDYRRSITLVEEVGEGLEDRLGG